jgi:hypothetical protein
MKPDSRPAPKQVPSIEGSRQATLASLQQLDDNTIRQLTRLTLPEIQAVKQEVAQVLPAGNLPAFVLSGLLKLKGRRITPDQVSQDVAALMRGVSLIPQGLYGAMIAGPAAVLYAYQKLLQLAGKDPADAFPQGTWQFYLQFGLREDSARHTNETIGFHRALPAEPEPAAMAAAWLCAALELVYSYDDLLALNWAEGVMLRLLMDELSQIPSVDKLACVRLVREWNAICPYHHSPEDSSYVAHRQATFQQFVHERVRELPAAAQKRFHSRYAARLVEELPAYQEQMSLLAALQPEAYQERREPIPLWQACIAFIWQEHTYLLPVSQRDPGGSPLCYPSHPDAGPPTRLVSHSDGELYDAASHQPVLVDRSGRVWHRESGQLNGCLRPPRPETVCNWVKAIFSSSPRGSPASLELILTHTPRPLQSKLRAKLPAATQAELHALRRAPIIINWDRRAYDLPLSYIRQGRRGIGDHALTLFHTDQSMVFDQSHIFFDGMWGLAIAEVLTDSAVHWHARLCAQPDLCLVANQFSPQPLALSSTHEVEAMAQAHYRPNEAAAESAAVDTNRLSRLRRWLLQRGVHLTINDLLLLYRFFHAAWYQPSRTLIQALEAFYVRAASPEAREVYHLIETSLSKLRETNPALLIPMDASNVSPCERVFPTTFRNPLTEIRERFVIAQDHRRSYRRRPDPGHWTAFDKARRELLTYLKAFGEVMEALKAVTMRGESFNTATIRLLAHLPSSMQHLLDQIPQRIGVLNEIVKGNEVFSNVGRVAPGTSLTRFMSAKDDGQTKELIWGILTDDQEHMHISLRDFRPFMPGLLALGESELANCLAQDYLDGYVNGLNRFVIELSTIITLREESRTEDVS